MTRIGILSYAHLHAASYIASLQALPEVEVVGIADDNSERGHQAASTHGIRYFDSYEALLGQNLNGVIVTSENINHLPLTKMAVEAGAHVLCEKPIATTMEDGREMIRVCREAGVQLMIAYPCRYSPAVQSVKAAIERGDLGEIYGLKATNRGQMPSGWFTDLALSGGGAVIDHTVHVLDLVGWFWRSPVKSVFAEVGHDLLWEENVDDAGLVSFRLNNGIFGTLDCSWSRPRVFPTWGDVTMEIVGQKGWLQLDMTAQQLNVFSDARSSVALAGWGSNTDIGLVRDFVDMVAGGGPSPIPGEDGLYALEVALAAYRANETGAVVNLPL